jgi:magnesium-transporting ATPase (P-type)
VRGGEPLLPVQPVQILWINLIVAVALALPLALEAPEPDLMDRPPRDRGAPLLDRPLLVRTLLVSVTLTAVALALFAIERDRQLDAGARRPRPRTGPDDRRDGRGAAAGALPADLPLVTRPNRELGWWSNPAVYVGIASVLALQAAFVLVPFMHEAFGSARIDLQALAWAVGGALLILPVTAVEERWRARA